MEQSNFSLSYSNSQKEEIQRIKAKYVFEEKEKTDLEKLRELDKKVESPGQILSLLIGITGTLIAGGGMSLILEDISLPIGIILGVSGIITMIPAYPVYKSITKKRREKFAAKILELVEKSSDFSAK